MDLTIHSSILPQNDPRAAVAFYRDALGFEVRLDVGYGDRHWIAVGPATQPSTGIVLYPPQATPNLTDDVRRTVTVSMAKGTFGQVVLES
ncbi:MAG: VOC family protein, partial [Acidimicrobiales bacterium]